MNTPLNRRRFLKTLGMGALATTLPAATGTAQSRKPNVVLIFTDDQGALDANCYGSEDLHTPNMDALARRGVRFSQFYVGAPVCSPSRACLLTGRYPQRAGVPGNCGGQTGLPPEQTTIAEMLKAAGYPTAIFGKWHLGELPEMSPLKQGFDEFFGHKVGCIDNYSHFFYWSGPNRHDLWRNDERHHEDGRYFPDLVVREAHRFLETHREEPFFLYLPFNLPHYPLQAQESARILYTDTEEPRSMYAAFVTTLDEKIGQVVAKLEELGLRDDTVIIFLSDHGHSVEERTFFGGGNAGPYRGHKFTLWEGGIRVPCIVSWPGHIPEGETRDQLGMSMDWLPTIAHYCGVALPDCPIDGKDLSTAIENASAPSPHDAVHWERDRQWAVREGNWKLVANGPETPYEETTLPAEKLFLSNFAEDITETKNLADRHPDIVERLAALHEAWAAEVRNQ
ncbi:MAG TPA: sulfatase-like hydrolase/transferase [Candidatus Hydrogenedentes bacterium]|nr:sulfatase-like hydrolase/transferase [Candidatus Hydrogenedentota bacterium]